MVYLTYICLIFMFFFLASGIRKPKRSPRYNAPQNVAIFFLVNNGLLGQVKTVSRCHDFAIGLVAFPSVETDKGFHRVGWRLGTSWLRVALEVP